MWDCLKEDYQNIEPVYTENPLDGSINEKYVYPDGSIKIVSTEVPTTTTPSAISTQSVTGGNWHSGSGYSYVEGTKVSVNSGLAKAKFYADFELINGGYEIITRYAQTLEATLQALYPLILIL